jgi:hypothetical protein
MRYYDPLIGRWVSEDPVGYQPRDANLYGYVRNNPANFTDPSGNAPADSAEPSGRGRSVDDLRERLKAWINDKATNGFSEDEKAQFRKGFVQGFTEQLQELLWVINAARSLNDLGVLARNRSGSAGLAAGAVISPVGAIHDQLLKYVWSQNALDAKVRKAQARLESLLPKLPEDVEEPPLSLRQRLQATAQVLEASYEILNAFAETPLGRRASSGVLATVTTPITKKDVAQSLGYIVDNVPNLAVPYLDAARQYGPGAMGYVSSVVTWEALVYIAFTAGTAGFGFAMAAARTTKLGKQIANKLNQLGKTVGWLDQVSERVQVRFSKAEGGFETPDVPHEAPRVTAFADDARVQYRDFIPDVASTRSLPELPEGYHYRTSGGQTIVALNPGRAGDLPQLHLDDAGDLRVGPDPSASSNTTRLGVVRNNPRDWRNLRDVWDQAGVGDILSPRNRQRIADGLVPEVDDHWIRWFPGDDVLRGESIPMHHIQGTPLTVPLPASRHLDAHMPGGFRYNPGGPGRSG